MAGEGRKTFRLKTDTVGEGEGLRQAYVVICQNAEHLPFYSDQEVLWFKEGDSCNKNAAEKWFRQAGWHTVQRHWVCPYCWNAIDALA